MLVRGNSAVTWTLGHVTCYRIGPMPMLNVGVTAPDFTSTANTGETIHLADLRGKNVVLWFYPKADTPG